LQWAGEGSLGGRADDQLADGPEAEWIRYHHLRVVQEPWATLVASVICYCLLHDDFPAAIWLLSERLKSSH
jgi:hypothetical protein